MLAGPSISTARVPPLTNPLGATRVAVCTVVVAVAAAATVQGAVHPVPPDAPDRLLPDGYDSKSSVATPCPPAAAGTRAIATRARAAARAGRHDGDVNAKIRWRRWLLRAPT